MTSLNPFKYRFFNYVVLPISLVWGGLQMRYGAPQGYNNPVENKGITNISRLIKKEIEDEAKKLNPFNSRWFVDKDGKRNEYMLIREQLALVDLYNDELDQENSFKRLKTLDMYYLSSTEFEESNDRILYYKISTNIDSLRELQRFSDSVVQSCLPGDTANLVIEPQKGNYGLLQEHYDQAEHYQCEGSMSFVFLSSSALENSSVRELKTVIGHELGHKVAAKRKLFQQNACKNEKDKIIMQRREERFADSLALEFTKDPDAVINFSGRSNLTAENTVTLLGRWSDAVQDFFSPKNHPLDLNRAQYAQRWKETHLKRQ